MINIELHEVFTGYTVGLLAVVIVGWIRLTITSRQRWKSYEDQVFQCRQCDYKFIVNALDDVVNCPNCQGECELRWAGKRRKRNDRNTTAKSSK